MNEMIFSNDSWLFCFSSEYIRNSTLKTQNIFFRANSKGKIKTSTSSEFFLSGRHFKLTQG